MLVVSEPALQENCQEQLQVTVSGAWAEAGSGRRRGGQGLGVGGPGFSPGPTGS